MRFVATCALVIGLLAVTHFAVLGVDDWSLLPVWVVEGLVLALLSTGMRRARQAPDPN